MFQVISKRSVSDEVFDQLCNRIVSRELKAGEDLPSERLLSEMPGVSRHAVREAIKRLQQARLVEVKHGGTTTENGRASGREGVVQYVKISVGGGSFKKKNKSIGG